MTGESTGRGPDETVLEVRNVSGGYRKTMVIRDVSLTVRAGGAVALLGANGVGKTTLLRLVSGLLRCASGQILLDGRDVVKLAPNERSRLGLCHIPEGRGVFARLTVRDNLLLQAGHLPRKSEAIDQAVDIFPRLGDRLRQPAANLSGGERQMLALARAYISNPRVVLVDEVSMGLAPLIVDQIYAALADLRARGVALVVVEQYVAKALGMCDYLYFLNRGSVSTQGPPDAFETDSIVGEYLGDG
jgi:branched-chain amino acid transport system ATP-binding protein